MNWTQIVLAVISTAGTVLAAMFAGRASNSASAAAQHAEVAKANSIRPPGEA